MDKEDLNLDFTREKTEDFTEILNSINKDAQELENDVETLDNMVGDSEKRSSNDDFLKLVKKRDYKGFDDDIEIHKDKAPNPKRRLKKWVYLVIIVIFLGVTFGIYKLIDNRSIAKKEAEEKALLENIKNHYSEYVKVSKDTGLYIKENDSFKKIGTIYQGASLELKEVDIDASIKYFEIKDIGYYVKALDVSKDDKSESSDRYKSYLPFNINIVTKDSFTMYLDDDKLMTIDKEMSFPVIINNYDGKYYVEYNNKLVNIKKDDIEKTEEHSNTDKKNQSKITTLAYHRVYDTMDKCNDPYVCIKKENFDKQMKYLSDNSYITLTMDELYMYLKGNLQIEKGVVITLDDGYQFISADEVLDKYHLNATMFVITGEFDNYEKFENLKAISVQSHTHNMHRNYVCAGGNQGGAILCASKEKIVNDIKKSLELLKVEPIALAYPFYDYNENAINALKEVGIKMAFIGRAGVMGRATPKVTNLYKIPRMTVWEENLMSFNSWKSYL